VKSTERWRERLRVVGLEARIVGQCQAAVAEAVEAFGRIDVLLCAASEGMSYESACLVELIPDALQLSLELLKNWHRAVVPSASLTRSLRSTSSQM
jgi:NAD(P)-dependent dehydrogenase (short-subunit alcohol dehydrogenase family)